MFRSVIFLLCTWVGMVQASELVVIRSTHESLFAKGDILNTQETVNLPMNVELTVVFDSGNPLTLKGPYQGKLADPAPLTNPAKQLAIAELSNFVRKDVAVRGETETRDLWSIDVDTSKRNYCVASGEKINLSRPMSDSSTASTVLLKHKTSGQQVQLTFTANQTILVWPTTTLPVIFGDTYTLETKTLRGRSSFKKLVLYQLPADLPTKSHQVVWMVGKGCTAQAGSLLISLR
jgi:hypothetical protein